MTVSPMRNALLRISNRFVQGRVLETVVPPTNTGSSCGHRRELAGAADLDVRSRSARVVFFLRRVLLRHRPWRWLRAT
jgi:hypothetical protein